MTHHAGRAYFVDDVVIARKLLWSSPPQGVVEGTVEEGNRYISHPIPVPSARLVNPNVVLVKPLGQRPDELGGLGEVLLVEQLKCGQCSIEECNPPENITYSTNLLEAIGGEMADRG